EVQPVSGRSCYDRDVAVWLQRVRIDHLHNGVGCSVFAPVDSEPVSRHLEWQMLRQLPSAWYAASNCSVTDRPPRFFRETGAPRCRSRNSFMKAFHIAGPPPACFAFETACIMASEDVTSNCLRYATSVPTVSRRMPAQETCHAKQW